MYLVSRVEMMKCMFLGFRQMPCFFGPSCFVTAVRSQHIYFEVDRRKSHTNLRLRVCVGLKSDVFRECNTELRIKTASCWDVQSL